MLAVLAFLVPQEREPKPGRSLASVEAPSEAPRTEASRTEVSGTEAQPDLHETYWQSHRAWSLSVEAPRFSAPKQLVSGACSENGKVIQVFVDDQQVGTGKCKDQGWSVSFKSAKIKEGEHRLVVSYAPLPGGAGELSSPAEARLFRGSEGGTLARAEALGASMARRPAQEKFAAKDHSF